MEIQLVETLILVLHVAAALAIIGLVLVQQGRGADMGSGFGGGSSNTVFGSSGSGNFLTRATTFIAVAFFVTSFGLAFFAKQHAVEARNLGIPQVVQQPQTSQNSASGAEQTGASMNPAVDAEDLEIPVPDQNFPQESEIPEG